VGERRRRRGGMERESFLLIQSFILVRSLADRMRPTHICFTHATDPNVNLIQNTHTGTPSMNVKSNIQACHDSVNLTYKINHHSTQSAFHPQYTTKTIS
jgi:hypothetical protein